MNLGHEIIQAIIRADAIERAIFEGDATIYVWKANAAEQIEAALSPVIQQKIRDFAKSEGAIMDVAGLLKVGAERGAPFQEIATRINASTLLNFFEIEI